MQISAKGISVSIQPNPTQTPYPAGCLSDWGEMDALMRSMDWSKTVLGPVELWPPSLRVMVRVVLANGLPMVIWWGPQFFQFYNDAFSAVLGGNHPSSMGQPASECWTEIWHIVGPLIEKCFHNGEATLKDDLRLEINRHGFVEETHWTIAFSPVPDDTMPSQIGGVLGTVNETTEKIVAERRRRLLRELGAHTAWARTAEEVCALLAETLGDHREDVPFALLYLIKDDRTQAKLCGVSGLTPGRPESGLEIDLDAPHRGRQPWRLGEVLRTEEMQVIDDLQEQLAQIFQGPWPDSARSAVVCPIRSDLDHQIEGFILLGISSRLHFDDAYRGFCELVSGQLARAISNARSYAEMHATRERMRAFWNNSPSIMFVKDLQGRYLDCNTQFSKVTPLTREQILGKTDLEIFPRELADVYRVRDSLVLEEDRSMEFEGTIERQDGKHTSIVHRFPLRNAEGQTDAVCGIVTDITERKQAEEALRKSEERFRRYFDLGLIGMAITSPAKGCLEVNDELCRILGYERSELLQKTWAEMTHPEDLAADMAQFNRVLAGELDGYTLDKRWIRKDGRVIDSIMAAQCMRHADGSVDYLVGLVLDTTERKRAETALREAHDQRQMILNSLNDRFFALDSQWRYTYFNRQAEAQLVALGKDPARLMGRVLWEEFPNPPTEEILRRAMRERISLTHEHYYALLGEWVENRVYPTSDGGLAIFQQYVTERKKAEDALRAIQTELAHVTRVVAMGELTASIAHEINQPLTAVVANANACNRMLSASAPDLGEVRAAVQDIAAAGARAAEVISHIRGLLGKAVPEERRLDANEIICEVLSITKGELQKHKITVLTELHPHLPPVLGDRVQLQQVVLNLILNAIEAMAAVDEPRVLCARSGPAESGGVLIAIEDSGPGFEAVNAEQIFDRFFTTKKHGMGMGLAISRSIIAAHGGRLWAEPVRTGGTRFKFTVTRTA